MVATRSLPMPVLRDVIIQWPPNYCRVSIGKLNNLVVARLLATLVLKNITIWWPLDHYQR
jgi:hypothetical protein